MTTHSGGQAAQRLPARPNLEKLKKDAKDLRRAFRAGEIEARKLVQEWHPRPQEFSGLRDAQLTIARLYGHPDWQALCDAVELRLQGARSLAEQADLFMSNACLRYSGDDRAHRYRLAAAMLEQEPRIADVSLSSALAAGRLDSVRRALARETSGINAPGGPLGRPPLLYLTYSRVPAEREQVLAILDLMLENGADPDSRVLLDGIYPFTAMAGAMGEGERGPISCVPHACADEIVARLLAAGASANETQGLYNTQFTASGDKWLKVLLAHGLREHPESKATLEYALGQAVTEGRLGRVQLLLEHGVDPNTLNAYNRKSCLMNATIRGQDDIAAALRAHGARTEPLPVEDEFRVALRRGDEVAMLALLDRHPTLRENPLLLREAAHFGLKRVLWLIDRGFDVNGRTPDGRTLLMELGLWGELDTIKALIARGANPDFVEKTYGATALGFALHNRRWNVVEFLVAASNNIFDVCRVPHLERARVLLGREPSLVALRTPMGNTPLHVVSQARDDEVDVEASAAMIDLLLAHGADPAARNNEGLTPLGWYRKLGVDDLVDLMRARGAS
jgi:ankyrin repeat protein